MSTNSEKDSRFLRILFKIVIPITLQYFMFALVPVCDAVMLVVLDQDQMSAVSLATQVMFVYNLFISALLSGLSMFASQYWGKGDKESIGKLSAYMINIMLPICLVFFALAMFMPEATMRIYTNEPAIIAHGIKYLRVVSFAYIFDGVGQLFATLLKNVDKVKESTVLSIIMVVINIFFNAVFIYGLFGVKAMGAAGSALGTTIAFGFGMIAFTIVFFKKCNIAIRFQDFFHVDIKLRKAVSKYVTPTLVNSLMWGIGFSMITVIMGHLGSDAVAANSIVAVAKDLISCFCFALASGSVIMVGNELGANELERAKKYGSRLVRLSIVSGIIAGVILAASTPIVVKVVNLTPMASHYLTWMLIMCVYYMVGRSVNSTVISGVFTAGGDTKFGMICDTITMWAFIVPVGALAAFILKLPVLVVFFLLNLDEIIKLPAVYIYYKKYNWVKNIVNEDVTLEINE